MTFQKNNVLLLKAQKVETGTDMYEQLLTEHGLKVKHVKTLDFIYKNLDDLKEKLMKPCDFSGLIFSSPRCVNAVYLALDGTSLQESWKTKFNFVVGEATYKDVLLKLGLDCKGKETGNADNLSKFIIEGKSSYEKPFLFPHGNLKTDTLKTELGKEGLTIEGVLVYDTIPNPSLEDEMSSMTNNFTSIPEYIVFYSPSGVHNSMKYLHRLPINLEKIKFIAIGPVTEKAIKEENLPVYNTAKLPTPEDVLKAIKS